MPRTQSFTKERQRSPFLTKHCSYSCNINISSQYKNLIKSGKAKTGASYKDVLSLSKAIFEF